MTTKLYTEEQLHEICQSVAEKIIATSIDMETIIDRCNYYGNSKIKIDINSIKDLMEDDDVESIILIKKLSVTN